MEFGVNDPTISNESDIFSGSADRLPCVSCFRYDHIPADRVVDSVRVQRHRQSRLVALSHGRLSISLTSSRPVVAAAASIHHETLRVGADP